MEKETTCSVETPMVTESENGKEIIVLPCLTLK
jgi:hypothetical protein